MVIRTIFDKLKEKIFNYSGRSMFLKIEATIPIIARMGTFFIVMIAWYSLNKAIKSTKQLLFVSKYITSSYLRTVVKFVS